MGVLGDEDAAFAVGTKLVRREAARVAIVGAGPAGASVALHLAGQVGLQVDVFEKHSMEECWRRRGYWTGQPADEQMHRWKLNAAEIQELMATFNSVLKSIPFCRIGDSL